MTPVSYELYYSDNKQSTEIYLTLLFTMKFNSIKIDKKQAVMINLPVNNRLLNERLYTTRYGCVNDL